MKPDSPVLALVRELVRTYQAFERLSAAHLATLGLTAAQFDVVATLGNTPGMNPKQLGEKTLITKGTLTGVIDRLVLKGLVERHADPSDGRCQIVRLSAQGDALFAQVFPQHVRHIARAFAGVDAASMQAATEALHGLRQTLENFSESP